VAIYGDLPPPDSVTEIEPGPVAKNTYGWIKLQQDQLVKAAAQNGLPTTILCPPNICGPYSYFLLQLIDALAQGEFALLEDGSACCSTVDVRNLAHAIDLALRNGAAVGRRYFVTDDADVTWARLVAGLTPLLSDPHIASVNTDQLQVPDVVGPKSSVLGSILHLVSSDVREALRKDPLLQRVDVALRGLAGSLGSGVEERLRESIEGPINVTVRTPQARLNLRLCAQQLRGVQHSCDRLKRELGYAPLVDFDTSMRAFRAWYIALAGTDGEGGDLLDHLAVES
jgi:nucleoside-diphosphate-sugar epimerase